MPYATVDRRKRKTDRRATEASVMLTGVLEHACQLERYPRAEITVTLSILQSDGSELAVALNAATLALVDAGVAMSDMPVACTAGYLAEHVLTDLTHQESSGGDCVLPVAWRPTADAVAMIMSSARLAPDRLAQVVDVALHGCRLVYEYIATVVKDTAEASFSARVAGAAGLHEAEEDMDS